MTDYPETTAPCIAHTMAEWEKLISVAILSYVVGSKIVYYQFLPKLIMFDQNPVASEENKILLLPDLVRVGPPDFTF